MITRLLLIFVTVLLVAGVPANGEVRLAIVPGGEVSRYSGELLALSEAKLFALKTVELLERTEIDKVLAEQKLSGMFDAKNAVELGRILKTDIFAVLETTSIVIFDAKTGLRFVDETLPDETLPEKLEAAAEMVAKAVMTAAEKRQKLTDGSLVTFGVLEVRNADFPVDRDAWCRAVAGMLERSLLHRGGAVLERSRLQHVNKERQLTGDTTNVLLSSMKLIDLEFTRGEKEKSFKMTARIGTETFHAESPIDKPLDTVNQLAGLLLGSKDVTETSRKAEAARFARESRFFGESSLWSDALEKIEVAVALDPENTLIQRQFFRILESRAMALLSKARGNFKYDNSLKLLRIDADTMRQAFRYALRIESLDRTIYDYPAWESLRDKLTLQAKHLHPEFLDAIQAMNRRAYDHWMNESYRKSLNNIVDQKAFFNHLAMLDQYLFREDFLNQSPADQVEFFAEVIPDTLRLTHQYELGENQSSDDNELRHLSKLYEKFSTLVTQFRFEKLDESNPESAASIERVVTMLEEDSRLMPRIYAWLARNRSGVMLEKRSPTLYRAAEEHYAKVVAYLTDLPKGIAYSDYTILYSELRKTSNLKGPEGSGNFDSLIRQAAIIELADSRNECSEYWLIKNHFIFVLRIMSEGNDKDEYLKRKPRYDSIILRQIALAEEIKLRGFELLKSGADDAGIVPPDKTATENAVPMRPWVSEVRLLAHEDVGLQFISSYFRIRNNTFYHPVMKSDEKVGAKFYLVCIDLETLAIRYIPTGRECQSHYFQYVDDDNAYCVRSFDSDQGLYVYPLDGSNPWSLTLKDDLPSADFKILGTLNGFCYANVGDSWIIRIDLKTQKWEQLSSVRAKTGKTPFVDGRKFPRSWVPIDDPKRERILLLDGGFGDCWEIRKDGKFVRLPPDYARPYPRGFIGNGNTLLFTAPYNVSLFDCETETESPAFQKYHMYNTCVWNGYYWGGFNTQSGANFRWSRCRIDGESECEPLAVPELVTLEPNEPPSLWLPDFCVPTPDDKGLIVGKRRDLILLRFDFPSADVPK